jgi:hypothetical protein
VLIKTLGDDKFNLTYKYCDDTRTVRNSMVLSDTQLFKWLRHTVSLLENDDEPFEALQMDLPFMPSVLFSINNLEKVYHAILDAFEFHLNNWAPESKSVTTFKDEYADMPPLVPDAPRGRHHLFLD